MEPREEGFHKFEVTFSLSSDGLLTTTVHHLNEGKNYQGQFNQASAIGAADMLAKQHEALRAMFTTGVEMADARPPLPPGSRAVIPPVPPPDEVPLVSPENVPPGPRLRPLLNIGTNKAPTDAIEYGCVHGYRT